MRCKPGDLAVVVLSNHGLDRCNCLLGRIIQVTTPAIPRFGMPAWNYAGRVFCKGGILISVFEDNTLRPLPPPSDVEPFDAQRELEHS